MLSLSREYIIQTQQNVYKEFYSGNKKIKVLNSQKMVHDLKTIEEQEENIKQKHERAHRGFQENFKVIV